MNQELWYLLIEGQQDSDTGIFGSFYVYGNHLGDALKKTLEASAEYNFISPDLIEATLLESLEQVENADDLIKLNDSVYMNPTTHAFPSNDPGKLFIPPTGIVKSTDDGEYEYDLIKENFVAYGQNENGIFELELVVGKANLIEVFLKSILLLPSVDGFWMYIQSFWENDRTELWVAKHFVNPELVIQFLETHSKDTLKNGNVKIVAHSSIGETNVALDDHKKIQLHTKDEEVFRHFISNYIDLGYSQTRDFYNLEYGFHHWHYRPAGSLTRNDFKGMLVQNQFELLDAWDE